MDEHRQQFALSRNAKVEVRGPCYSACTLLLAYVEPDNLCIAPNAFMAFHAVRSMEHGEIMVGATQQLYSSMPAADPGVDQRQRRVAKPAAQRLLDAVRSPDVGDGLPEM